MFRVHLRSLHHEPALIYGTAVGDRPTPLKLAGPANVCQTLKTLLAFNFPQMQACKDELKTVCTQDPLFRQWFTVEAIVDDVHLAAVPRTTVIPLPPTRPLCSPAIGDQLLWRGLLRPDRLEQALQLQAQADHLSPSDWMLAERLLVAGVVAYEDLEQAIQQMVNQPQGSLCDWLRQQRLITEATLSYLTDSFSDRRQAS